MLFNSFPAFIFAVGHRNAIPRADTTNHEKAFCSELAARVWEAATGKKLLTLKGHNDAVVTVAFSPDGQWIVTGSHDYTVKLWESATGKELLTLKGNSEPILSVAFSPDGQRIAAGSYVGTVKVWEVASPAQVAQWQKEEQAAASKEE